MSVTGEVVSTKQVPKSLGCFFEEEGLPLAAFASTSDITRGLAQMGISDRTLATIAVKLKTQVSADRRAFVSIFSESPTSRIGRPTSVAMVTVGERGWFLFVLGCGVVLVSFFFGLWLRCFWTCGGCAGLLLNSKASFNRTSN
jgi:hypothetical protein